MKKSGKENFDQYFRDRLTSAELSEVDEDWNRMKVILQRDKQKKVVTNVLLAFSAIAAILIMVLFTIPNQIIDPQNAQSKLDSNPEKEVVKDSESSVKSPAVEIKTVPEVNQEINQVPLNINIQSRTTVKNVNLDFVKPEPEISSISESSKFLPDSLKNTINDPVSGPSRSSEGEIVSVASSNENNPELTQASSQGRFSVAINLAQDFNGVNSLNSPSYGYGFGAGLSYQISKKLSVDAGLGYSKKVYGTSFSNYKPKSNYVFRVNPTTVDADCDVIDLQLNMNYTFISTPKSKWVAGLGLSSYQMIRENYAFQYADPYARGPRNYTLENQNKHLFGIANLKLTYKREVGNGIGLAFSPFLKLPLSDIGYGNVRLKSAGINIGIIKNIKAIAR